MPRTKQPDLYVATRDLICEIDGERYDVHRGERVRSGHVLLRAQGDSFEPADTTIHYDVEQATQGPGERRGDRV